MECPIPTPIHYMTLQYFTLDMTLTLTLTSTLYGLFASVLVSISVSSNPFIQPAQTVVSSLLISIHSIYLLYKKKKNRQIDRNP